jgi:hypothetical protein
MKIAIIIMSIMSIMVMRTIVKIKVMEENNNNDNNNNNNNNNRTALILMDLN